MASQTEIDYCRARRTELSTARTDFDIFRQDYKHSLPDGGAVHYKAIRKLLETHYATALRLYFTLTKKIVDPHDWTTIRASVLAQITTSQQTEVHNIIRNHNKHLNDVVDFIERHKKVYWGNSEQQLKDNSDWLTQWSDRVKSTGFKIDQHSSARSLNHRVYKWLHRQSTTSSKQNQGGQNPTPPPETQVGEWYGSGDKKDRLTTNFLFQDIAHDFDAYWKKNREEIIQGNGNHVEKLTGLLENALTALQASGNSFDDSAKDAVIPGQSGSRTLDQTFVLEDSNNYDDHVGYKNLHGYNYYKRILGGETNSEEEAPAPGYSRLARRRTQSGKIRGGAANTFLRTRVSGFQYTVLQDELDRLRFAVQLLMGTDDEVRLLPAAVGEVQGLRNFQTILDALRTPVMLRGNDPDEQPRSVEKGIRKSLRAIFRAAITLPRDFSDIEGTTDVEQLVRWRAEEENEINDLVQRTNEWISNETSTTVQNDWITDGIQYRRVQRQNADEWVAHAFELWYHQVRQLAIHDRLFELNQISEAELLEAERERLETLQLHERVWNIWDMTHKNKDLVRRATEATKDFNNRRRKRRTALIEQWAHDGNVIQGLITNLQNQPQPTVTDLTGTDPAATDDTPSGPIVPPTTGPKPPTGLKPPTGYVNPIVPPPRTLPPLPPPGPTSESARLSETLNALVQLRNIYGNERNRVVVARDQLDPYDMGDFSAINQYNVEVRSHNQIIWSLDERIRDIQNGSYNPITSGNKRPYSVAPFDAREMYVDPPAKKRRMPLGIKSLAPGPMPGEHPKPGMPRVLIGGELNTRDPYLSLIPPIRPPTPLPNNNGGGPSKPPPQTTPIPPPQTTPIPPPQTTPKPPQQTTPKPLPQTTPKPPPQTTPTPPLQTTPTPPLQTTPIPPPQTTPTPPLQTTPIPPPQINPEKPQQATPRPSPQAASKPPVPTTWKPFAQRASKPTAKTTWKPLAQTTAKPPARPIPRFPLGRSNLFPRAGLVLPTPPDSLLTGVSNPLSDSVSGGTRPPRRSSLRTSGGGKSPPPPLPSSSSSSSEDDKNAGNSPRPPPPPPPGGGRSPPPPPPPPPPPQDDGRGRSTSQGKGGSDGGSVPPAPPPDDGKGSRQGSEDRKRGGSRRNSGSRTSRSRSRTSPPDTDTEDEDTKRQAEIQDVKKRLAELRKKAAEVRAAGAAAAAEAAKTAAAAAQDASRKVKTPEPDTAVADTKPILGSDGWPEIKDMIKLVAISAKAQQISTKKLILTLPSLSGFVSAAGGTTAVLPKEEEEEEEEEKKNKKPAAPVAPPAVLPGLPPILPVPASVPRSVAAPPVLRLGGGGGRRPPPPAPTKPAGGLANVAYTRPRGAYAARLQADAHRLWQAAFPHGRRRVATPGDNYLCGLYAVMISMRAQHPGFLQPTMAELQRLDLADPGQAMIQETMDQANLAGTKAGGGNNFAIDHLSGMVMAWGARHNVYITLCIEIASTDGNPRPIYFTMGGDMPTEATIKLWIQHNNVNHYSGLCPLDKNGRDVEDVSKVVRGAR